MVSIAYSLILFNLHILNHPFSLSKRFAQNPSQIKTFSIDSIMEHNQDTPIEPIYTSSSKFGVEFENQFVVLDDAKHIIGIDASDPKNLILEDVENEKGDKFGWRDSSCYFITNLIYDEDTGSLYTGDDDGHLLQFKVHTANKTCERVKDFGDIGIDRIFSSHRFMHFVFFGGSNSKIKILDLSRGELLLGHVETSIKYICSLQVCMKSNKQIYLTVSGASFNYSGDKTDLFDLTDLLLNDPEILQRYLK